jgi:hypothetical protein
MKRRNENTGIIAIVEQVSYPALLIQLQTLKVCKLSAFLLFSERIAFCTVVVENAHNLLLTAMIYKGRNKKIVMTGSNAKADASWM